MNAFTARSRAQDGSLVMALLAVLVVGGLVAVLVSRTGTTQRQVRFDRDYQLSVNAAEAGLQQALMTIQQLPADAADTELDSSDLPDTVVGETEYEWTATLQPDGTWGIRSEGTRNGVTRYLEGDATQDPKFFLAAFGRYGVRMVGNNVAESYTTGELDTGLGSVGSNGLVSIIGNTTADLVQLFGPNASCGHKLDPDAETCNGVPIGGTNVALDFATMIEDAEAEIAGACTGEDELGNTTSKFKTFAITDLPFVGGETYCFTSLITSNNTVINTVDATVDKPVRVYVTGDIELGNGNIVNCPTGGCDYSQTNLAQLPNAGALQITSTGSEVRIGNHVKLAAAVMAPKALCRGNPSSAQTDIYGSIICERVGNETSGNQGGWSFYFDTRLLQIGNGRMDFTDIREEVGGSTSLAGN